ncbi:tyrosine-type recombinase/integrase [Ichthyenterobacterium magnum]|uniref:Site-specific recombinase XerD n=1 Tax=Ichthyenterobacterium magnum TaxID=1230530 RepID=A0A420DMJ2_9FLAO|nr:tyrosine-type recombinase/integrase [Ichthyenterobacterium magnum]RKE95462.1 site-specific recombinase XerD [Ichthyenterobacterium magnum]
MSYLLKFKTILELKRYTPNTMKTYLNFIKLFSEFFNFNDTHLEKLTDKDIITCTIKLVKIKQYSASSQKQLIGALNLFYKELFKRHIDFSIIYPSRSENYLPQILSKHEIKQILEHTNNIKHKAILATIYGMGLRISEAVNLKINDIDSNRMLVHIKNAKGKKDRIVMLPESLLALLRIYFKEYRPKVNLFEGQHSNAYSAGSIRKILKLSANKAKIKKPITVHTLRHTFATHLLENGTDIRIIQRLLGHKNIGTTLQYTQVAQSTITNVVSPLDAL